VRFQIDELALNELAYVQFSVALVTQEGEMGMNETPPQAPNPAEVYESYLVPHLFTPFARDLVARAGLKIGERVLDVACGTGIVVREVLPTVGPNGRVAGVDFNPAMLTVARTRIPGEAPVEWYEASAEALPFSDAAFDLILCQQGLQFFPDKPGAIREFRRVLAPGGRVALSVWRTLEHNPVQETMNEAMVRHLGTPTLAMLFSGNAPELEALLSGSGFEDVAIEPVTMTLRFPSADRFVQLSALAGAAVSPVFAELDEAEQASLVEVIQQDVGATLQRYTNDDEINVSMAAYVATAHIPAS
jgi:ubiquinone/menaquinone biosynthesis C-methylase UbiE